MTFDILVHFGTLLAVLIIFRQDIAAALKNPFSRLPRLIAAGSAVTAVVYLVFRDSFTALFQSGRMLGVCFLFTGFVLLAAEGVYGRKRLTGITVIDAAVIGLMQGLAILPAISRSGLTIAGALLRGLDRETAAQFSFLLSIPVILGANLLELKSILSNSAAVGTPWPVLLTGTAAAALSGYFAVRLMLRLVVNGRLLIFAYYVLGLGTLVLADQLVFFRYFPPLFR